MQVYHQHAQIAHWNPPSAGSLFPLGSESGESRAGYSRVIDEDNLSDSGIRCNGKDQILMKQFKLEISRRANKTTQVDHREY